MNPRPRTLPTRARSGGHLRSRPSPARTTGVRARTTRGRTRRRSGSERHDDIGSMPLSLIEFSRPHFFGNFGPAHGFASEYRVRRSRKAMNGQTAAITRLGPPGWKPRQRGDGGPYTDLRAGAAALQHAVDQIAAARGVAPRRL